MIEMAVSAAILALVVGGFYATFGGANQYAVNSRLNTSAKIVLGSALNEALGTPWTVSVRNPVHFVTASPVPYSIANEGVHALPTPRADGEISLFTTPTGEEIVSAQLTRNAQVHPERSDMLLITFTITWSYRGKPPQSLSAYTVVARDS